MTAGSSTTSTNTLIYRHEKFGQIVIFCSTNPWPTISEVREVLMLSNIAFYYKPARREFYCVKNRYMPDTLKMALSDVLGVKIISEPNLDFFTFLNDREHFLARLKHNLG